MKSNKEESLNHYILDNLVLTVSTINSDDAFCIKIGLLNLFWLDCNQFPKQLNTLN